MKISILGAAVSLALGTVSAQAVTLTMGNGTGGTNSATPGFNETGFICNTSAFKSSKEFRMCDPSGALGGGIPLQKDTIIGGEAWMFSGSNHGLMTGVSGTGTTGGLSAAVTSYIDLGHVLPSIDRDGGPALDQGALFFGGAFGFLAPTVGSEAVTVGAGHANDIAADPGEIWTPTVAEGSSGGTFTISFDVLEAQWNGTHFGLGSDAADGGEVTFYGTLDSCGLDSGSGTTTCNFSMWAEEMIEASEDFGAAGFGGWTAQWFYQGTIDGIHVAAATTNPVPVPAAVWLFGSGLVGLAGVARRRKKA